jgi:23S rRNA pseudouridine955/2504/2580 synthase
MIVHVIDHQASEQRLDRYLSKLYPKAAKGEIQKWVRTKKVKVNGAKAEISLRLNQGDEVKLFLPESVLESLTLRRALVDPGKIGLDIVYEDDAILVVDKPWGLLTHPDKTEYKKTLSTKVQYYLQDLITPTFKPASVNRLDKNTSGLVLFCKTYESLKHHNELMRERKIEKRYLAIVEGEMRTKRTIKGYLIKDEAKNRVALVSEKRGDAKAVVTVVEPIVSRGGYTKVSIDLITGRSHQIRASLDAIGHPIIGDSKYGGKKFKGVTTQVLHAYRLTVEDRVFEKPSRYLDEIWASIH